MTMTTDSKKFTVWLTDAASLADAKPGHPPTYYIDNDDNDSMEKHGWIKVTVGEHQFKRPDLKAILPAAVTAIRKEMEANNLKAFQENAILEAQISRLMAIEYDAGVQS